MNLTVIIVIVLGLIFCIGGPIIGHYASMAAQKAETDKKLDTKN